MILFWSLLAFLAFLVALLAVPLEWAFNVRQEQGQRESDSHVLWLFGLVRFRTTGSPETEVRQKPEKKRVHKKKPRRSKPMAAFFVDGFVGRLLGLVKRLLASIQIQHLKLQSRVGLGDPADTGCLWAFIGPLSVLLSQPRATQIDIEPDFYEEVLDFDTNGRVRVVPLRLLGLVLGFLLSPNTWRAWRTMSAGGQ